MANCGCGVFYWHMKNTSNQNKTNIKSDDFSNIESVSCSEDEMYYDDKKKYCYKRYSESESESGMIKINKKKYNKVIFFYLSYYIIN